ncbi:protein kinase [Streptomyces sp. NPDC047042]|uniref:serine/threonine protein kinase n=1 Tax=Streptomyces sp. NPDC047042 TaxID=3154807 RepID=UPI00340DBF22
MSDEGRLIADRYRVLDRIGRGGMATVWRAHDDLLGRQVAVKKLHPQPHLDADELATLFERARREARSAARISHPNVVVVHDVVDDEGVPVVVMEYVPSTTLGDLVAAHGPVPTEEVARIGLGVLAALRAAHRVGILHRDVKPANVLLAEDGRVVLTDFGIAQAAETSSLTRTGQLVGSVDFMAPERLIGAKPGPEADLWALGATLFQAVEGRSPFFRGTVTETMYAIAMEPPPEVQGAGPLAPLIQGLLIAKPTERMSAEDAERLLRTVEDDLRRRPQERSAEPKPEPESGPRTGVASATGLAAEPPRSAGRRGRSKKLAAVAAVAVTAVLVTVALSLDTDTEKKATGGASNSAASLPAGPLSGGGATPSKSAATPKTSAESSPSGSPTPDVPSPTSSGGTSPTAQPSQEATPKTGQEDPDTDSGDENPAANSGSGSSVAPAGHAFVVAASGKCLSRGAGSEGTQLFQATCDNSAAQQWQSGADGTLRSAGKCMTVEGGATDDRTEIQLTGCSGDASQRFHLSGTRLLADQSQKCVDIFGGASGTGAVLWECNGRDNQTWTTG